MTQRSLFSIVPLIIYNLLPLAGVIFWDWTLFTVLLLYWIESGVIGFFNLFRIGMARAPFAEGFRINNRPPGPYGKLFVLFFFPLHYGIFWLVHGVFVLVFFGMGFMPGVERGAVGGLEGFDTRLIGIAALAMFINHAVSFFFAFIGEREYEHVSPDRQMMEPYSRVLVMHGTILGGAWLITQAGTPIAALVLLVVLKLGIDLFLSFRESRSRREESTSLVIDQRPGS